MSPKRWIPCELHTHTVHSDATHTLDELADSAVKLGFEAIALTDHNTTSAHLEVSRLSEEVKLEILPGLEWTTFHGHMLVLGTLDYVDWRSVGKAELQQGIEEIHKRGGLAGLAHPFRVGSPMCTGCYWEYQIDDWNDIDFIEVWSGVLPSVKLDNREAFRLWTDCLNRGYTISATSGRDWHNSLPTSEPVCATYVGVDASEDGRSLSSMLIKGLKKGAITISMGPRVNLTVATKQGNWGVGDTVPRGDIQGDSIDLEVEVDFSAREGHWSIPRQRLTVALNSNLGNLAEIQMAPDECEKIVSIVKDDLTWVRAELKGIIHGVRTMIGFTNPIYFSN